MCVGLVLGTSFVLLYFVPFLVFTSSRWGRELIALPLLSFEVRDIQSADAQRPFILHVYSDVSDFNRNLLRTDKLLKQGARYHKLRKSFSKLYQRRTELIVKIFNDELKIFIARKHFRGSILLRS